MIKIIGLLNYYNGMPILEITYPHNLQFVDECWCFDGAYKTFLKRDYDWFSDDESDTILKRYKKTKMCWLDNQPDCQRDKRNYMFSQFDGLSDSTYILVFDCDELLRGDPDKVRQALTMHKPRMVGLDCYNLQGKIQQPHYPRLLRTDDIYRIDHMAYGFSSRTFGNMNDIPVMEIPNFNLINLKELYSEEYRIQAQDFYRRRRLFWGRGGKA